VGRRYKILLICAFSQMFWALPAAAQVEFKGVTASMSGSVAAGYSGDLSGEGGGSDHGMVLGGAGALQGSFYNPNFISFSATPYYNRSQSNSDSQSIFDSSGYSGNINIFSGSRFPGNISFGQDYNTSGLYGIPGTIGLTTKGSNRVFGIGWSALLPDLPSLSVGYSRGSGSSSLLGSEAENSATTDTFTLRSGYKVKGMGLTASFIHEGVDSNTAAILEGGSAQNSNTSSNTYQISGSRGFYNGGFGVGFSRSTYSDAYTGEASGSSHGATDSLYGSLGIKLWKVPLSASVAYTDNLEGNFEEQLLSDGVMQMQTNLSPVSHSLLMSLSSSDRILPHMFVTGFVSRQEEYIAGTSAGLTQFGANVSGNFGERLKGLTATVGVIDSANQEGNEGASLVANVNYRHNLYGWEFEGNFGYDQSVQTLLAIYQTSTLYYGGALRHKFARRVFWNVAGGGGRSAFVQVAGNSSHSESVTTSFTAYGYSAGGNYSKSEGTSVITPTGLVTVPVPIVSNNTVLFNGIGRGLTVAGSPVRRMSITASFSQAFSNTLGLNNTNGASSTNKTSQLNGYLTYQFRRMYFNAGVLQFRQDISAAAGIPPSVVTSYYFGISRWFKAF
jgi:hypothetical protein